MTKEQIAPFARQITYAPTQTIITFTDKTQWVGFFHNDNENPTDEENNFWSFEKFIDKGNKHHFNGDNVISIEIKNKV